MSIRRISDYKSIEARDSVTGIDRGYKDLGTAFKIHPAFGDIRPLRDLDAVKNSIKNILQTRKGERPFQPKLGCNLKQYLFEPVDPITTVAMEQEIRYSIGEQEPRVDIQEVLIQDDPEGNSYYITITVLLKNRQTTADVEIYLERLR